MSSVCYLPAVTIPLIPASQRLILLKEHHDNPSARHLGFEKTATKVCQVWYWVGMLQDIDNYCESVVFVNVLSLQHQQKPH